MLHGKAVEKNVQKMRKKRGKASENVREALCKKLWITCRIAVERQWITFEKRSAATRP
jgi:hypothetical protein